ncbi:hypothetical protein Cgig2_030198 [Carnegiea gigantea]|uniref:NAC domain-containing protein n=1 Tax=Carnegiea gigantea TaxID=171969 RepID=A0A9Q1KAE3_9CARY|nr:hypothetical protein Cgig2_030198 [Carnegiea gigantea]
MGHCEIKGKELLVLDSHTNMDQTLATKSMPPGFRFHPTDEELLMFYLKRKVMGRSLRPQMMSELDIYRFAPWDLPDKSWLRSRDLTWYFFCPRSHKYSHGARTNRSTEGGYWKSTGNDRAVEYRDRPVGKIKTLVFHQGKPPKGERTDWVMHEYRLDDKDLAEKGVSQETYVICKVYKKSGLGPKNGEQYGAPFVEEEWGSDNDESIGTAGGHGVHCGGYCDLVDKQGGGSALINVGTPDSAAAFTPCAEQLTPVSAVVSPAIEPLTPCLDAQNSTTPTTPVALQPTPVGVGSDPDPDPVDEMGEDEVDEMLAVFTAGDSQIDVLIVDSISL